jgi:hypothetical protein
MPSLSAVGDSESGDDTLRFNSSREVASSDYFIGSDVVPACAVKREDVPAHGIPGGDHGSAVPSGGVVAAWIDK